MPLLDLVLLPCVLLLGGSLAARDGFYVGAPLPWKCKKCQLRVVSVVEAGREAAALMLGMMWARWRQAYQLLSLLWGNGESRLGNLFLVDS